MSESGPRYAAVGCGTRSAISDGNEKSRMYPDKCKKQAEDFLIEVECSKREGKYVDPRADRIKFRQQAGNWIKGQSPDRAARGHCGADWTVRSIRISEIWLSAR
jgi:hypothetical protein